MARHACGSAVETIELGAADKVTHQGLFLGRLQQYMCREDVNMVGNGGSTDCVFLFFFFSDCGKQHGKHSRGRFWL